jgi:branched-chain amino acid transport system ATP-binding protein
MITVENLTKAFGGVLAVKNVSLSLYEGEILGLIGPNGAGKTTLFSMIAGFHKPTSGEVFFKKERITGISPNNACKAGIARTFQIVKPFGDLSVLENVMIGALCRTNSVAVARKRAHEVLDFVGLATKSDQAAHKLTICDRKRLEMARALGTGPQLILLDEVMAGLNPTESAGVAELVKRIRDEMGMSLLVIEHVMSVIMYLSDRICVLDHGELIATGAPSEIVQNEKVIKSYLGVRRSSAQSRSN